MQISKEIIDAFFAQQCTPEEAKKVSDYLSENPGELERYLPSSDWERADMQSLLPETFWQKQWERIESRKRGTNVIVMMKRIAVAAILILAVGAAIFILRKRRFRSREALQ